MTKRSTSGSQIASDRKHVTVAMSSDVRRRLKEAAQVHDWSMGDLALAWAAEQGPSVLAARAGRDPVRRVQREDGAVPVGLYMTPEEAREIDEVARSAGLTRSVLVEVVARLALGDAPADVYALLGH
jgi:hypothetical protein